jgi:hypothetical protein
VCRVLRAGQPGDLTDGYAGVSISRPIAVAAAGQTLTIRAKATGQSGTLTFCRFAAIRLTAPNPTDAAAYAAPSPVES